MGEEFGGGGAFMNGLTLTRRGGGVELLNKGCQLKYDDASF